MHTNIKYYNYTVIKQVFGKLKYSAVVYIISDIIGLRG